MNPLPRQLAVLVTAGVLLVAGCTGQPSADPTALPTPSAAPTEPDLTEPRTALALSCDELFGLDELQPLLATPVQVRRDETSAPLGVRGATLKQAGATLCVFGGEHRTNSSYDQGLWLQAVPDASASFETHLTTTSWPPSARMDTIGDRSVLSCQGSEVMQTGYLCGADFVVGDFWVSARMSDTNDLDSEAAADLVSTVLTTIAERIAASGPARSLWVPPAGSDPAAVCSDPAAPAALLGEDAASLVSSDAAHVEQGVTVGGCTWTGGSGAMVSIATLESGAWAFDAVAASPGMVFHPWLAEGAAHEVMGTDGALVTCVDGCYALVSWQGSLVGLSFEVVDYDPTVAVQRLQAWGAALP